VRGLGRDGPGTAGRAGPPRPEPRTGCNGAASAQRHDPAASSDRVPDGSRHVREDSLGGSGAMYAAGADAGRWQCWGRMVAESCFKIAHCDGVGHPLRSALWIELEFARLWSRTRPGNPHSTKVGNRRPRARASEALQQCLTPRGSGSTGQGLSILHEPPTPIQ